MITPHGGRLVSNIIRENEAKKILQGGYKKIEISKDIILEIENLSNGVYSPLEEFPSLADINSILNGWRLTDGTVFPIPPLFHIDRKSFKEIKEGDRIILAFKEKPIGSMVVKEKSKLNKSIFIKKIFRTNDKEHPGVAYIQGINENIITGPVKIFKEINYFFNKDALTPAQVRKEILKRRMKTITAFSTTNIPHRAHEYLQRLALEFSDGLFIHVLFPFGNIFKFRKIEIKKAYSALINNYFPKKNIIFSFLPILPRSAGPRSALMQAIIRQNFGCTHQIFGRDHDGFKKTFNEYESQKVFDRFPEIELKPLNLKGPYYCTRCETIVTEKSCKHSNSKIEISGTDLREMLRLGKEIPKYYIREEVLNCLENRK